MGESHLGVGVDGLDHLERVTRELGAESVDLPAEIRKAIREMADGLAREASAKVLTEPTFGPKHTGLRALVAHGVGVVEMPGGGSRVTTSMPQVDEAIIPRGFDSARGWRHPVFGHRDRWVTQRGAFSWFLDTMQHGERAIQDRLRQTLEDAADRVGRI